MLWSEFEHRPLHRDRSPVIEQLIRRYIGIWNNIPHLRAHHILGCLLLPNSVQPYLKKVVLDDIYKIEKA